MHAGQATGGDQRLAAGGYRPILNQVNLPGSTSQPAQSSPAKPSPKPPSPCAGGRGRELSWCCGHGPVCLWCICVRVVCIMYVRAGGVGTGWGSVLLLLLPKACPKYIHYRADRLTSRAGQHIVCGHCSCRGLLQISRPGPPACWCAHSPVSPR